MSISMSKYVRIKSGVGGSNTVRVRELILRLLSTNVTISPDEVLEFEGDAAVGAYFGMTSPEYSRALQYFGYVSPNISSPRKISFGRDQNQVSPPLTIGESKPFQLAALKALSSTVAIVVAETQYTTGVVAFDTATTIADVAASLQAAIRAIVDAPPVLASATVVYDPVAADFTVTGGIAEAVSMRFLSGIVADGLLLSTGIVVTGIASVLTPVESYEATVEVSNNFGTIATIRSLALEDVIAVGSANANKNVTFMYLVGTTRANAALWSAATIGIASLGLTIIDPTSPNHDELIPASILAATEYMKRNSVVNYMYRQQDTITAKVNTDTESDRLDKLRTNYYGETQTAGQKIAFYQRGVLMGGATAPVDMNVHGNEQWLKDHAAAGLLTAQLTLGRISANQLGEGVILSTLQDTVDHALNNGTISIGKPLTIAQKLYIAQLTGDSLSWIQIQNIGYLMSVTIESYATTDNRTEYKAVYQLIYSKDDAIRKVEGTHILI